MMDYITSVFEDAKGRKIQLEGPVELGTNTTPDRGGTTLLGRVQLVQFFVDQADIDYLRTNEKNPSSVGYLSGRFAILYNVAGQEVYRKAALVNPSLHNTLKPGARQPHMLHEHQMLLGWRE